MAEERVQRRLAAIIAADVVGYSRMMGADETGTLARLQALRKELLHPKVAEYGGRIVKTTGDGALIEFPSAVDAVQHAVDVQTAIMAWNAETPDDRRIVLRMGINVGDIIAADDDIYGDGVNVAARLEALAEPGGVCISSSVFDQVKGKLDLPFADLGLQSVKNIVEPVRVYQWQAASAGVAAVGKSKQGLSLAEKPAIAVLPFDNMSGDTDQDYFADGIAEDLITALSRFRWFFVIARNSSFTYKGKAVDIKTVARELGVQYAIEGSVRKAGSRVRITAQMIDAPTGRHIWAERYDRDLSDIFEVQDEITTAITGAVGLSFSAAEAQKASRKPPENLDAWDMAMRATGHVWHTNKTDLTEAKRLYRQATDLDPNSSYAWSGLAMANVREGGAGLADDFVAGRTEAEIAAHRALEIDDQDAWAHLSLAWVQHAKKQNVLARNACYRALELNPNLAAAEGFLGLICAHLGAYEESLVHIEKAVRLSPRDPSLPFWNLAPVVTALVTMRDEEYLQRAKDLTETSPNFIVGWRHLAVALVINNQIDDAKNAMARALELAPTDCIASILASVPIADVKARDRYIAALRKIGYPEVPAKAT